MALRIPRSQSLRQSLSRSLSPIGCLILANAWCLVISLLPHHHKLPQGKVSSDGLSLLKMPFFPKSKVEEVLPLYYLFEGLEFMDNRQLQHAKACYLQGLSEYPEQPLLKNALGVVRLQLGEFGEARTIFAQLLEKSDATNKILHALLLNNLAAADILFDRQGLLEEADTLSAQVYRSFPWIPAFKGTRGSILMELGELDEGIALLKQAMEEHEKPYGKAIAAAYLAIAEARRGNIECAEQYLDTALQFDATCFLIGRARDELPHAR